MTDERVADRHLVEMRERAEQHEVVQIEVVPRVDPEAERVREVGGRDVAAKAAVGRILPFLERVSERLRVELDARRAQRGGPLHGRRVRLDEEADPDAALL